MFSEDRLALQALDETIHRLTSLRYAATSVDKPHVWYGEQEQLELQRRQHEPNIHKAPISSNANTGTLPRLLSSSMVAKRKEPLAAAPRTNFAAITLQTNRIRSSEREVDLDAIDFEEKCAAPGYFERTLRNKDTHLRASDKRQTERPPFLRSTYSVSGPAGVRKRRHEAAKLKQLLSPNFYQQQQQQQQQQENEMRMQGLLHLDLRSVEGIQCFLREYTSSSTESSITKSFAYLQDQMVSALANNKDDVCMDEEEEKERRRRVSIDAASLLRGITYFYETYTGYALPDPLPFELIESLYCAMKIDTASSKPHIYYGQFWLFCAQEEAVKEYLVLEEAIRARFADCLEQQGDFFVDFLFTELFPLSSSIPSQCRVCRKELKKTTCYLHNWSKEDELEAPRKTEQEKAQTLDVVSHFVFWDALSKLDLHNFTPSQLTAYYSRFDLNGQQRYFSSRAFLQVMTQGSSQWEQASQIVRAKALAESLRETNVLREQQRHINEVYPNLNDQMLDMAASLGIKPVSEPHFLWIAKFATQASSLPPKWTFESDTTTGKRCYRHTVTNTLHSKHPTFDKLLVLKGKLEKSSERQSGKRRVEAKQGQNLLHCLQLLQQKEEEEKSCRILVSTQQDVVAEPQQEAGSNRLEEQEQAQISTTGQCSIDSKKEDEREEEEEEEEQVKGVESAAAASTSSITNNCDFKESTQINSNNEEDMQFMILGNCAAISESLILEGSSVLLSGDNSLAGLRVADRYDKGNASPESVDDRWPLSIAKVPSEEIVHHQQLRLLQEKHEQQVEQEIGAGVGEDEDQYEEEVDDLAAFSIEERLVNAAYQRALQEEAEEEEKRLLVSKWRQQQQAEEITGANDADEGDRDDEFDKPLSFVTLLDSSSGDSANSVEEQSRQDENEEAKERMA